MRPLRPTRFDGSCRRSRTKVGDDRWVGVCDGVASDACLDGALRSFVVESGVGVECGQRSGGQRASAGGLGSGDGGDVGSSLAVECVGECLRGGAGVFDDLATLYP